MELDSAVHIYVPSFPLKAHRFSVKQLAGHLSGIPHYTSQDRRERRYYNSVEESLGVFSHIDLLHKPGAAYQYSTHGYTLLSAVIEGASESSFLDYLNKAVFKPLGMRDSGPHLLAEPSENMTVLYDIKEQQAVPASNPEDPSYKWGGGGMVSTPSDLVRMASGYLNGFIKPGIVSQLFTSQSLNSGEETGVGVGWRRSWDMLGNRVFEHAGGMQGTRTVLSIFPDQQFSIALMTNANSIWRIEETAHLLALPFLTKSELVEQPRGTADVTIRIWNNEMLPAEKKGRLILDGTNDQLVMDSDKDNPQSFRLIYLERTNIYALVHPHGLLYTTIAFDQAKVSGCIMHYGSSRNSPPGEENPRFVFEGVFSKTPE